MAGQPRPVNGVHENGDLRLESWKEIALYLKRSVSTVQRWERQEGLPVRRLQHSKLGSIYAYPAELDAWWNERRLELEHEPHREGESQDGGVAALLAWTPRAGRYGALAMGSVAVLGIIGALTFWYVGRTTTRHQTQVRRFSVSLPPPAALEVFERSAVALSPDGLHLAYVARRDGTTQVHVRRMDSVEAGPVPGTEGASGPFFSTDGEWLGYFAQGQLKKVRLSGGAPVTIADAPTSRGASWAPDDTIVFTPSTNSGLWRVPAAGGTAVRLTAPEPGAREDSHRWPEVLPGGDGVLYTVRTAGSESYDDARIAVYSQATGRSRMLVEGGTQGRYAASGHLVYARSGQLLAVGFDAGSVEVTGRPVPVVRDVSVDAGSGAAHYGLAADGTLAYVSGGSPVTDRLLVWVDRGGRETALLDTPRAYLWPRVSAEGRHVAFALEGSRSDVWAYDRERRALSRLTFEAGNTFPVWGPDASRLTFSSSRSGVMNIYTTSTDGGAAGPLLVNGRWKRPGSWSPDGRAFAFVEAGPDTGQDIWVLTQGESRPRPFLRTPFLEGGALFSPDGRWLAYVSDESGRNEVYVAGFPDAARKTRISTDGGGEPVWSRSGREIFYRRGNALLAVPVANGAGLVPGQPRVLLEGPYVRSLGPYANYDVAPDDRGFLMVKPVRPAREPQLQVVLGWFSELGRTASLPD